MFAADTPPDVKDLTITSSFYYGADHAAVPDTLHAFVTSPKMIKGDSGGACGRFVNKERQRRGKMANMYSLLQSFLPNLASSNKQASREKIVTETIEQIKRLEADKSRLEEKIKAKAMASTKLCDATTASTVTISSSSGSVSTSNNDAMAFEIKWLSDRRKRTMTDVVEVFDRYGAEILTASVVVNEGIVTTSVTAVIVNGDSCDVVERIKRDLLRLQASISYPVLRKLAVIPTIRDKATSVIAATSVLLSPREFVELKSGL
ncbi:hypothetical protein QQ045_021748 [Rhodiola kirilowii]